MSNQQLSAEAGQLQLDASETSRRKRAVSTARKSVEQLLLIEEGAFDDLDQDALREVVRKLASRIQQ